MQKEDNILSTKQFALGTWEAHLWTEDEQSTIFSKMKSICQYIDTAVDYNNDWLLSEFSSFGYKTISKIAPCHFQLYDFFVDNHLKCLGKAKLDIMLIHSSRGDWKPLAQKLESDSRFSEVGVSNFNVTELEEYKKLIGHYPAYNEIEINPHYTDVETAEFCKKNCIKVIAYGIFGGKYNATANIADFSVPYLISYAAMFADILILKPECERHVNELADVVQNYNFSDFGCIPHVISEHDKKAVVPMRYDAKDIWKMYRGQLTYHNACGKNGKPVLKHVQTFTDIPQFEMLGDYMAYARYKYRQTYDGSKVYEYDFLIGDDGFRYAAYLYDDEGRISKINTTGNVAVVKFEEER